MKKVPRDKFAIGVGRALSFPKVVRQQAVNVETYQGMGVSFWNLTQSGED